MSKYYRVEQSETGCPRSVHCGATSHENATARLASIVENMEANSWKHTDEVNIKKLATVVMLTDGSRVVTLSVMECTAEDVTRLDLREMSWLSRTPMQTFDLSANEDTREILVDRDLTPDDIYNLRDGSDEIEAFEVSNV